MNQDHLEVLNITQEVLRGFAVALLATQPHQAAQVGAALQAFAGGPGISPMACAMLANLAEGVNTIAAARAAKN